MPEYLHPGVYIEETSYRGKPIQGVSTSTAGLVGAARKGPEGTPFFVSSLNAFRRTFGDPISPPTGMGDYLGHAVKAFFENGGSRAYIVRVLGNGAAASQAALEQGTVLTLPGVTLRGPTRTIPLDSLRRVTAGTLLRVFTRPTAADAFSETRTVTVESYDPLRNRVRVAAADEIPTGVTLEPENTYFLIDGEPPHGVLATGTGPTFRARNRGVDGDRLAVRILPTDLPPVALTTRSALRDQPEIHAFPAQVADNTPALELPSAALRRLRTGDRISVGSAGPLTIASIDPATITFNIAGGVAGADFSPGGGTITLIERGGAALPTPIELGTIPAGAFDLTGTPPDEANTPHDVAATLAVGDVIQLVDGANTDDLEITGVQLSQDVAAGAHVQLDAGTPVTPAQTTTPVPVRLVATSDADPEVARLVVGDASRFTAPFRAGTGEAVAVTDGSTVEASTILLVDPGTNTLYVDRSAAAADEFSNAVTVDNWISVESLQVAVDGQATLAVASTGSFYNGAKVEVDTGTAKFEAVVQTVDAGARTVTLEAGLGLGAGNVIDVAAAPGARAAYIRTLEIEVQVLENRGDTLRPVYEVVESFPRLSWNDDTGAESWLRYFVERINDEESGSKLVEVTTVPAGTDLVNQPTTRTGRPLSLGAGSNGGALTAVDLIGTDNGPGNRTGIEALAERDDISMVAVPGVVTESVQAALITHCERLKYRIAVLDGERGAGQVTDVQAHRNNYDSKYAAYYAPWLKTLDLSTGRSILVPPSGYAMGIYARTDTNVGVHKAPANEVVRNVTDVEFPFGAAEQDVLNPVGINLIRDLTPRGIRLWGARTISSDQEWKYVNVRRLFIYIEHSIDIGTQWVVFEPNSESLWSRVVETITAFLTSVWKTGALMGTTADQAFFVRCDRSTMTQSDIDNGRLICEIGIAPVMPAEFVIFRIGQFTATAA